MHIYIHINEWDWWNSGGNFEIKVRNVIVRLLRMLSKCKHADQRSGFFLEYDRSRAWKSNLCPCNKKKSWTIRVLAHTFETVRDIRLQNKLSVTICWKRSAQKSQHKVLNLERSCWKHKLEIWFGLWAWMLLMLVSCWLLRKDYLESTLG